MQKLNTKQQELNHLSNLYSQHSIERKLKDKTMEIEQIKESFFQSVNFKLQNFSKELQHIKTRFPHAIDTLLNLKQNQLLNLKKMVESNNPKFKTKKGFAQISQNSKTVELSSLREDDIFDLQSDRVSISAKVLTKKIYKESV
jgi:exodeoxyribonuclease VII large subunit